MTRPALLTPSPGPFHNTGVAFKRICPAWKYRALGLEIDSKYFQKSMSIRTKARLNELWAGIFWFLRGKEGFNSKHFLKGDTLEIQLKEQRAVDCPGRENKVGTSIFSWGYSDIPTVIEWIFYSVSQRKRSRDETWQGGLRLDGTKNVSGNEGVKYQTISLKEVVKCRFFFFPSQMVLAYSCWRREMEYMSSGNLWKWQFCSCKITLLCTHKKGFRATRIMTNYYSTPGPPRELL